MRNAFTQDLPPIGGFIPEPLVIELGDSESAWIAYDAAQRELDDPQDKQALSLFLKLED